MAALVIAAVVLVLVRRSYVRGSSELDTVRSAEPTSFACYFENGKRGVGSARNGELIVRLFKGKTLVEDARPAPGSYVISPARVQLTPVRQADGIAVSVAAAGAGGPAFVSR